MPTLFVRPGLTLASVSHTVTHGVPFTVTGASTPNMAGRTLTVQRRAPGSATWQSTGVTALVAANGTYSAALSLPSVGKTYLRFSYQGSMTGQWRSGYSPKTLFTVT